MEVWHQPGQSSHRDIRTVWKLYQSLHSHLQVLLYPHPPHYIPVYITSFFSSRHLFLDLYSLNE